MSELREALSASGFRRVRTGFALPFQAVGFLLRQRGVKRYAILPLILNAFLYTIFVGGAVYFYFYHAPEPSVTPDWDFLWGVGAWLASAYAWIVRIFSGLIFIVALVVFCYFTFTSIGMVVASPINDMLSAKVEEAVTGKTLPGADTPLLQSLRETLNKKATYLSIMDSLIIQIKKLSCQVILLPLLFIPIINLIPLLVQAYWEGVGNLDVGMARNYLRNRDKKPVFKEKRWEIFGLGFAMTLLFMIPLLGLVFLPVGVTAGTLLYCECDWARVFRENELTPPEGFVAPIVMQPVPPGKI